MTDSTIRAFLWRILLTLFILSVLAGPGAKLLYTLTQSN
jgi:hypothetical protein